MRFLAPILICVAVMAPWFARASETPRPYVIVVNQANAAEALSDSRLADIFLRKTTRWGDQEPVRPVDLPADSTVRVRFTRDVLRRSVTAVRSYWQQLIFSGREVPPPEVDGDEAAVAYVARHRGGIGYVSANADTHRVRVIAIR